MKLKIDLAAFIRAAIFRAEHDVRYYLTGVQVEPAESGGAYIMASCGYMLMLVHDGGAVFDRAEEEPKSIALRVTRELVAAARLAARSKGVTQHLLLDGKRLSIAPDFGLEHTTHERFVLAGPGTFDRAGIDWRRVTPRWSTLAQTFEPVVNARYIAKAMAAAEALTIDERARRMKSFQPVRFWSQPGGNGGVVVQYVRQPNCFAIIMPMREDAPAKWLLPDIEAEVANKAKAQEKTS